MKDFLRRCWVFCHFLFSGVHRDLHCRDGAEADCAGSLLLLPAGLEHLRRRHRLPQSDGARPLQCRGPVCPAILQTGNRSLRLLNA